MHEITIYFCILIATIFVALIIQFTKNIQHKSNLNINHRSYLNAKQNFINKMIIKLNNTQLINNKHLELLKECHKNLDAVSDEISRLENQNNVGNADKIKSIIDERFLKFENRFGRNSNTKSDKLKNRDVTNKNKGPIDELNNATKQELFHISSTTEQDHVRNSKLNNDDIEIKKIKSEIMETLSKLEEIGVE